MRFSLVHGRAAAGRPWPYLRAGTPRTGWVERRVVPVRALGFAPDNAGCRLCASSTRPEGRCRASAHHVDRSGLEPDTSPLRGECSTYGELVAQRS
jgi:hypothetical protein